MNYIIPLLPLLQDIETKLVLKKLALAGVRQNSLFEENVAYDSYFVAFGIGRISIRPKEVPEIRSVTLAVTRQKYPFGNFVVHPINVSSQ